MSKCLGVFRANCETDTINMGSIFKAYKLDSPEYIENKKHNIAIENEENIIYFEKLNDLLECELFDQIEGGKDDENN